ncbi:MAG: DUF2309 family protein [Deltaproteobacteria bacterium]|nr:DUF2309 family protein [Deltaproteobacteria bacterium]
MSASVQQLVKEARELLPEQGPLPYFVHHNTLHHFEDYHFLEAVKKGAILNDAFAFMSESWYRKQFARGRIGKEELKQSIERFLRRHNSALDSEAVFKLLTLPAIPGLRVDSRVQAFIADTCVEKRSYFREIFKQIRHVDISEVITPVFCKFFAAYFDFGAAYWPMPERERGIWQCFVALYSEKLLFAGSFDRRVRSIVQNLNDCSAAEAIDRLVKDLPIERNYLSEYFFQLLNRYKGWAALTKSLEDNPEWIENKEIKPSLEEMLAVLLVLEIAAITKYTAWSSLRVPKVTLVPQFESVFLLKAIGVIGLSKGEPIPNNLRILTNFHREEIWQCAFEETLYRQFLGIYRHNALKSYHKPVKPSYQVFFCIDEREESLRRYLEQIDKSCETFGVAGHFALDMNFKGVFDKHYRKLCPPVVRAEKFIREEMIESPSRLRWLITYGELQWLASLSSKTLVRGGLQSILQGLFNIVPYSIDIISPAFSAKIKEYLRSHFYKSFRTRLVYQREETDRGYNLEERIARAEAVLRTAGATGSFAPYVFFIAHGSSSLNNPHEAAHDCGACGGGRGAPNARLLATILNEAEVRKGLGKRGITIPNETVFVGGYHNTCNDEIIIFDAPLETDEKLRAHYSMLKKAASLSSAERCRRFDDVSPSKSDEACFEYVQGRALDLTQPRPEYGHATNAFCIVGPRRNSKNLFLDRRAFLVSYDEAVDPDGAILKGLLGALGPVCAGISLEYYFSFVDNERYGCGTKLPHNITSLVGVMNGYMSDLQLGLPWQMVEIHEPTRLLMLVCCSKEAMEKLLSEEGGFQRLVKNDWISLVVHDEGRKQLFRYDTSLCPIEPLATDIPQYEIFDRRLFEEADHLPFGMLN